VTGDTSFNNSEMFTFRDISRISWLKNTGNQLCVSAAFFGEAGGNYFVCRLKLKEFECGGEVAGKRGFGADDGVVKGGAEYQHIGVQHLAGNTAEFRLFQFSGDILFVAQNGVMDVGEMFADLVCPPGRNSDVQVAGFPGSRDCFYVGMRG